MFRDMFCVTFRYFAKNMLSRKYLIWRKYIDTFREMTRYFSRNNEIERKISQIILFSL